MKKATVRGREVIEFAIRELPIASLAEMILKSRSDYDLRTLARLFLQKIGA